MFDQHMKSKIKNDKIYRWCLELSCYSFDIIYSKGIENVAPDTFSRVYCSALSNDSLKSLHESLCLTGVTRMTAFVRSRNLPFSVEDIRSMIKQCTVCQQCKPSFYKPVDSDIIKATKPFERLKIHFKGPLLSTTKNIHMLNIIDEYSRFPFVYPYPTTDTNTVTACLSQFFSLFGMPVYVHSDRGPSFMSNELKQWLREKGIATSRTTPYNPQGNGQTERYNGIIYKTVKLALKTKELPIKHWEIVLPDALHSIRSLINTVTNKTPHERMFNYQRKSATCYSVPSWLSEPGKVLLKRFVKNSKYEPDVTEVELLEANPQYAHIKCPNGRESTISLRHLAPTEGNDNSENNNIFEKQIEIPIVEHLPVSYERINIENNEPIDKETFENINTSVEQNIPLRRSTRIRKPPVKLDVQTFYGMNFDSHPFLC